MVSAEPKVAIVTGASSGLGRAIATEFARNAITVVCADLHRNPPLDENVGTVDLIAREGGNACFVRTNVSESADMENLIAEAVARYGRLDIMVSNAGIALESLDRHGPKPIHETDDFIFDETLAVNTRSVFLGCKYAIRQFLRQEPRESGDRGWIVNIASVYGLKPAHGHVSYCTSKAAVVHMSRTVAIESAPMKIHCNVICPGFVKTAMDRSLLSDSEQLAAITALHPWGDLGQPASIAKAAFFLASENASWVTGVALPVDGGYMLG